MAKKSMKKSAKKKNDGTIYIVPLRVNVDEILKDSVDKDVARYSTTVSNLMRLLLHWFHNLDDHKKDKIYLEGLQVIRDKMPKE